MLYVVTSSKALVFLRGQLDFLHQLGFDVAVACSPGETLVPTARKEKARPVAVRMEREITPFKDLVSLWRLWRVMCRVRPVVTNVGTPKAGLLGGIAAWVSGVPCRFYTLRGLRSETTSGLKRRMLLLAERISCLCAHRVLCVSESLRQRAVTLGIVDADRTVVLGSGSSNGVNAARFASSAKALRVALELRRGLGIPLEAQILGFVGRLTRDKGIPELLDAYFELRARIPELRLLLLGAFEEGDPLSPEIRQKIIEDPLIFHLGRVRDAAPYYHVMDVLALPTRREGFPNIVLEANAAAKPVVATRVTGAVDAVCDGVTGIVVPQGDSRALAQAVERLLRDRRLLEAMGRAGRERVLREFRQEFVWTALAREYERLLREKGLMAPPVPCESSGLAATFTGEMGSS